MIKYLKYYLFTSISLAIVSLDQATKIMIHTQFTLGEKKVIIPSVFNLTYVRNPGGIFGMFSQSSDVIRLVLFLILPILAFILLLSFVYKLEVKDKYQLLGFSLIFGGALGNYIDRIHFGYVIDFLDFYYKQAAWPTFNIGDVCIVIGVVIATISLHLTEKHKTINT